MRMFRPGHHLRILILATFVLAMLVPVLLPPSTPQAQGDHARQMATMGHPTAAMTAAAVPGGTPAEMMLCKQYCLSATATLPPPQPMSRFLGRAGTLAPDRAPIAQSRVVAPPGRPPKFAVI